MAMRIPKRYLTPLKYINDLDEASLGSLNTVLGSISPTFDFYYVASEISSKTSISAEDADGIVRLLVSLNGARDRYGEDLDSFVENLYSAVASMEEYNWTDLKERMRTLLAFDGPLGIAAKGLSVLVEHDKIYRRARILTDIRPVFSKDSVGAPLAATIVHTLKIEYNDKEDPLFIALDQNDLVNLEDAISRAKDKESRLKSLLKSMRIEYLDTANLEKE